MLALDGRAKSIDGYGHFRYGRKVHKAHRMAYELATGEIGDLCIDHICHNPGCVNPRHLRPVTRKQNGEHRVGPRRDNKGSGALGVHRNGSRWTARVGHNGERIYAGTYGTVEEAAAAVRAKRLELFTHNEADKG